MKYYVKWFNLGYFEISAEDPVSLIMYDGGLQAIENYKAMLNSRLRCV